MVDAGGMTGRRVLLMDDDANVCKLVARMAKMLGLEITTTADGTEAVTAFTEALEAGRPFDAVILDLTIPGGPGGAEVLQSLKRIDTGVRAIVVSGFGAAPEIGRPDHHGFRACLAKPFTRKDLAQVLERVIPGGLGRESGPG